MSRRIRILRNVTFGLVGFALVAFLATITIVQTDWFRNYVRNQIITATDDGLGGKTEVGSFSFNWRSLEAIITDFVIHGKEPAGAAPLVRAARVQVNLRLFTSLRRFVDISFLGIERPEITFMVFPDGTTNVPEPKQKKLTSETTVLDTLVDLAVDTFRISQGQIAFNSQKQTINVDARNLRAELAFNLVARSYKGNISLQPIYVTAGKNTPVVFTVSLPVVLERKRIAFDGARISTAKSSISLDGSLEDLNNPKTDARIRGHLALADLKQLGDLPLDLNRPGLPSVVEVEGGASVADNRIDVKALHLTLGTSSVEASGTLKDAAGNGALEFKSTLDLNQIGRLTNSSARPSGVVHANGRAKLDAANNYLVTGNLDGRSLAFQQGTQRIQNVSLTTALQLDPHRLNLKDLRLNALGGRFSGDASLEDFARYRVNGTLQNFDIQNVAQTFTPTKIPYSGSVSGPIHAQGDLKASGTKSIVADAKLSITAGRRGIPVSGKLLASYNGATDNVSVSDSYLALPNSRLNLNGSLNKQLNLELTSRDLNDLLATLPAEDRSRVVLDRGRAEFKGVLTGGLNAPRIMGHLAVDSFRVEGRRFDSLAADVDAAKNRASVSNGALVRGPMQAQFTATAGLQEWAPKPNQPLAAKVAIRNGDLADVMVLAAQPPAGYSGALRLDATIGGTIGNPTGSADVEVLNGTAKDEPFERVQAKVNLADQLITIPAASIEAANGQVNLTAEFRHPRESLSIGQLHAHVQSTSVDLARIRTLQKERPNTGGSLNLTADLNATLASVKVNGKEETDFQVTGVTLDAGARNVQFDGQNYGDVTAKATTAGQAVRYDVTSNFAGSAIKVDGTTQLTKDYPTTADATMQNLPIEKLLAVAKRPDIPARGKLSGTAHVKGTLENPEGNADLDLSSATVSEEPLDHVRARVTYEAKRIEVAMLEVSAGPSQIQASGRFDHALGNLKAGELTFKVNSKGVELARIRNVQKLRPGIGGAVQIAATGSATLREGDVPLLFRELNADIGARGITAQGKNLGDATLKATTSAGRLNFTLDSNLAEAAIHGQGNAQLGGDYPLNAELTIKNVLWSRLRPLLAEAANQPAGFEGTLTDAQISINGPALKTDQLRGTLKVGKVQIDTIPRNNAAGKRVTISNQGPVAATLERGTVRVDSAHFAGGQTDINVTGTVSLVDSQPLNLNVSAKTNLEILRTFNQDIYASGNVETAASIRGTLQKPLINGQLELKNASVNHVDFPNGLSKANGLVVFGGTTATIRNLTAESGGGRVTLSGFVTYADTIRLGLRASASTVRVRTQQGVSVVASGIVNVTGTTDASRASGTITINRITYAPQSDFGSILTRSSPPVQAAGSSNELLDNMRLDIRVRTSTSTAVQASVAQNLQLDADLRVRGTASQPGIQGQVSITEGDLVFFGSSYHVSSGRISFYNPTRIEPILDVSLETQAKGVQVILTVTGKIDDMKLSYTSDPPLQFQEIVQLLASGKTPTSDPTLLANQPSQPAQNFQQMGESAIVSKALADPVAGRLQRVFGVSQLKIDPTFTSGSDLPQARVTLQQQIASNLTFTYVTALDDPNTQIIRVEWTFTPQWSALASRDEKGIVSLNFVYKRQFR